MATKSQMHPLRKVLPSASGLGSSIFTAVHRNKCLCCVLTGTSVHCLPRDGIFQDAKPMLLKQSQVQETFESAVSESADTVLDLVVPHDTC